MLLSLIHIEMDPSTTSAVAPKPPSSSLHKCQSSQTLTSWNPLTHQPPRIDSFGFNREPNSTQVGRFQENILADNAVALPKAWTTLTQVKSLTQLQQKRKAEFKADPSYDLDGDGFVSSREYFIAKIFDKEKKGHLTSQERKEAEDALRNGFE